MGGGGLRILGHKKWHVWRRDNIDKVEKDEREFTEKQQNLQIKRRRIEQERRIQELEIQTNARSNEHINFFKEVEQNTIHDAVLSKTKNESTQKKMTLSQQVKTPWYANGGEKCVLSTHAQLERRKRELDKQDPLKKMRIEVKKTPQELLVEQEKKRNQVLVDFAGEKIVSTKADSSKNDKKHEKKKNKKNKTIKNSHDKLIEKLRQERNERERKERKRAAEIMKKH